MFDTSIRILAVTAGGTIGMTALVFLTALTWIALQAFNVVVPPL